MSVGDVIELDFARERVVAAGASVRVKPSYAVLDLVGVDGRYGRVYAADHAVFVSAFDPGSDSTWRGRIASPGRVHGLLRWVAGEVDDPFGEEVEP